MSTVWEDAPTVFSYPALWHRIGIGEEFARRLSGWFQD